MDDTVFDLEFSAPAVDQHVVDTIKRLQCLKQPLSESTNFQVAARELLEWCSDPRAFTSTFETYLMECLRIIRNHFEYDADLSYRVVAICASNGEKLTKASAATLARWSEELGKALLQRHKSKDEFDSGVSGEDNSQQFDFVDRLVRDSQCGPMHPGAHPRQQAPVHMLQKQYSAGDLGQVGWPGEAGRMVPGQPGSLSVVTTVWGMTPGTQQQPGARGPYDVYGRSGPGGAPPAQVAQMMRPGTPGYAPQNSAPPPFYRQHSMPPSTGLPGSNGPPYRPQYGSPAGNPDYRPPPEALSAAAMVAAAATATATATATASMMVQDNPHYHPQGAASNGQPHSNMPAQYNPAYARMVMSREMPGGGVPGPMTSQHMAAYRRPSPYPSHHAMMQRKQQYAAAVAAAPPGAVQPHYPAGMAPHPTSYAGGQMHPHHQAQYAVAAPNGRINSGMMLPEGGGPRAPPPYNTGPPPQYMSMGRGTVVPGHAALPKAYQQEYNMMQPGGHNMQEVKPQPAPSGGDMLLTFPVRDGTILPPFKLEHNLSVSVHAFFLKDNVFHTLMERTDLDLQLKCFHCEDRQQSPNWPASVAINVNNRTLLTDQGERTFHKPLYLKNVCVPGKNNITISVRACCCSHFFFLQVVHRPTVKSVLYALLKKNLLPGDQCINKIKKNFAGVNGMGSVEADIEQTSVRISLKCPITFRRIMLPARGSECCHIQCFDLESYLQLNSEKGHWRCPVCNKNASLESLEIDQYMWGIVDKLSKTEVEEINIDANASWKAEMPTSVKEEDNKADLCSMNNSWKVYSPSSTNLPSVGSYEAHHNPTSPYLTPPNSHNSGSNIAHYNAGVYDVQFNSPPDFTAPMSNRSDASEPADKRMNMLHRQQSGIGSPQGLVNGSTPYSMNGGPGSNVPPGTPSSATQGPASNAPLANGGPPSNAPASNQSNIAANNQTTSASELSADLSDLVNNPSSDNPLDGLDDQDLLAYLGPQNSNNDIKNEDSTSAQNPDYDDILSLLEGS